MRYFDDPEVRRQVNIEFANLSNEGEEFHDVDSLRDRGKMVTKIWWTVHRARASILQKRALKLLG